MPRLSSDFSAGVASMADSLRQAPPEVPLGGSGWVKEVRWLKFFFFFFFFLNKYFLMFFLKGSICFLGLFSVTCFGFRISNSDRRQKEEDEFR